MNELLRRLLFLPRQGSTLAPQIDALHYAVILTTLGGSLLVAVVAAFFLIRYRHRPATPIPLAPDPARDRTSRRVEFTGAGFLLALFIGFWVVGFRQFVQLESPPTGALPIQVVGKQWMWTFAYPNGRSSKGVLYVPAGRPVRLAMTSRDVIHSFFVPEFRVKKDVIPGRTTELWFEAREPGTYQVFCAEYCGEGHSTMRARLVALSEADYALAIEQLPPLELQIAGPVYQEPALAGLAPREPLSLAQLGERVATEKGCMRCHSPDGTPHIGPTWLGMYGSTVPLADGRQIVADAAYLTDSMMDPRARIHRGFLPVMPSYQGLLSAPETGALLEYLRALASGPAAAVADSEPSPLAPPGSPPIRLPSTDRAATDRDGRAAAGAPQETP
jgi:cytochrome c oxidase subunit 2